MRKKWVKKALDFILGMPKATCSRLLDKVPESEW